MIRWLFQVILFWWLISAVYRWLKGTPDTSGGSRRNETSSVKESPKASDMPFTGEIEDADFEEIDEREK